MGRHAETEPLVDLLHLVMGDEPLTNIARGEWRHNGAPIRKPELVERACWLRAEGLSFAAIGRELGIAEVTASMYVIRAEPSLYNVPAIRRRGGRPPGSGAKLSDARLRSLHVTYVEDDPTIADLARQLADEGLFPSWKAAEVSLTRGWGRLNLPIKDADAPGRRCQGRSGRGKPCRKPTLIGERWCYSHHPDSREKMKRQGELLRAGQEQRELIAA